MPEVTKFCNVVWTLWEIRTYSLYITNFMKYKGPTSFRPQSFIELELLTVLLKIKNFNGDTHVLLILTVLLTIN